MIARRTAAGIGMAVLLLPWGARAEPPVQEPGAAVTVMRGGRATVERAPQSASGVVVLRPPPGSFLRETTRLAAEAQAREAQAARNDARRVNRRLLSTLQAVEDAAIAAESRQRKQRIFVFVPKPARDPRPGKPDPARNETLAP